MAILTLVSYASLVLHHKRTPIFLSPQHKNSDVAFETVFAMIILA